MIALLAALAFAKPDFDAKAAAALQAGDYFDALKYANKALKRDSNDLRAWQISGEAWFSLAQMAQPTDPALATKMATMGQLAYDRVAELDPNSVLATLGTRGRELSLPEPAYECSPAAIAAFDRAEAVFATHDWQAARSAYSEALAQCPGNAQWWVWYGDAYFSDGKYEGALDTYQKGLDIDTCNWSGHRFSADAHLHLGDKESARRSAVTAVACNPGYDTGWQFIGEIAPALEVKIVRPVMPADRLTGPSAAAWKAFDAAMGGPATTALDAYRTATEAGLLAIGDASLPADDPWSALRAAKAAGRLDAAIYVVLWDANLRADYVRWRADHLEEAIGAIDGLIVPKGSW